MTIRIQYILFVALVYIALLVMSFVIFQENKWVFLGIEILLLLSLYFSYRIYRLLVQPIQLLTAGTEAIADQDFSVKFQKVGQKEMDKLIVVYNQMMDRLREERTIQTQQHYFLAKLIQNLPSGVVIMDWDNHITSCNPSFATLTLLSESELIGKKLDEVTHPLIQKLAAIPKDSSQTIQFNGIHIYKCHKMHFIYRGFARYFILIEELTAEKWAFEKETYSNVIRMMAHEVNNSIGPINSILDSLYMYQHQVTEPNRAEYAQVIQVALDRNQKLNQFMQNLATLARVPQPQLVSQDIRPFLAQIVELMKHQAKEKMIIFDVSFPDAPCYIRFDGHQLEQVLINVIQNAIEAITSEGIIDINLQLSPKVLTITDSGKGLDPQHLEEVFTPFFTTKPQGQGVGLTLVRDILTHHGFSFSLSPNAKGDTVFEIRME